MGPTVPLAATRSSQEGLPWSLFFDIPSLNSYMPVMEFDDYLAGKLQIKISNFEIHIFAVRHTRVAIQSELIGALRYIN